MWLSLQELLTIRHERKLDVFQIEVKFTCSRSRFKIEKGSRSSGRIANISWRFAKFIHEEMSSRL